MKLKYEFILQEVADAFVAVAVGDDAGKFNGLIRMNKTGKEIFALLRDNATEDEIVRALQKQFADAPPSLAAEVHEFVGSLADSGVLE